jgi:hypothetical protein
LEKFHLKKLNDVEVREQVKLKSQIGLKLWKTWIIWTSVGLGQNIRENIKVSKFQLQ